MLLNDIIELSNQYGSNPDLVLAGGGNTSLKDSDALYVKASGFRLADITAEGFVALDRARLTAITQKRYPADEKAAEAEVLADMMAAMAALLAAAVCDGDLDLWSSAHGKTSCCL